jgi:hypothetical protein
VGLKKSIREKLGIKPKVTMGGLGVLDIFADGKRIFSYQETRRMPSDEEVLALLQPLNKAP